jgi:hypothetical protein
MGIRRALNRLNTTRRKAPVNPSFARKEKRQKTENDPKDTKD